ncbi:MAG: tetratricopeptide repeat protein [Candidatus Omnitrophica bacterium]|nr:tetratricopeptide repeat protein [Candidatus Omnitrophota bacterium]
MPYKLPRCAGLKTAAAGFAVIAVLTGTVYAGEQEWIQMQDSARQALADGDIGLAIEKVNQASRIAEESFGSANMKTALSYKRLGELYRQSGEHEKALQAYDRTLQIWVKLFGPQDYLITTMLKEKLAVLQQLKRYSEAADLLTETVSRDTERFGENHTLVAEDYETAAEFFWMQDLIADAVRNSARALKIYEQTVAPTDPRMISRLQKTAELLSLSGRSGEAASLWKRYAESVSAFYEGRHGFESAMAWIQAGEAYAADRDDLSANECAAKAQALLPDEKDINSKEDLDLLIQSYQRLQSLYLSSGDEVSARKFEKILSQILNEG